MTSPCEELKKIQPDPVKERKKKIASGAFHRPRTMNFRIERYEFRILICTKPPPPLNQGALSKQEIILPEYGSLPNNPANTKLRPYSNTGLEVFFFFRSTKEGED